MRALRNAGHNVLYSAERAVDPGDEALLKEAKDESRVLITKDRDMGALVFRDDVRHAGVLLIDDLGNAAEETALLLRTLDECKGELEAGAFLCAGERGVRRVQP